MSAQAYWNTDLSTDAYEFVDFDQVYEGVRRQHDLRYIIESRSLPLSFGVRLLGENLEAVVTGALIDVYGFINNLPRYQKPFLIYVDTEGEAAAILEKGWDNKAGEEVHIDVEVRETEATVCS